MKFKEALDHIPGLNTVKMKLGVESAIGRHCLMELPFVTDAAALAREFEYIKEILEFLSNPEFCELPIPILGIMREVHDIRTTLRRLEAGSILDDVELFEIKRLIMQTGELFYYLNFGNLYKIPVFNTPNLKEARELLDPEKTDNLHFHIYDSYSKELAKKRKKLRRLQSKEDYDRQKSEDLMADCIRLEGEVRQQLTEKLRPHAPALMETLLKTGEATVLFHKAVMATTLNLCIPEFTEGVTSYRELRYLPFEESLKNQNKEFQPVDIELHEGVTLITGTNMGGKTITLKSVQLAQAMAQFGFCIGAGEARITPVEEICSLLHDETRDLESGLSDFGAEILRINEILAKTADGKRRLVIMDEPGRTTNPEEGSAIANAIIDILDKSKSFTLITTHYSNIEASCRRLKVKGIKESAFTAEITSPTDLVPYMDYSLVETEGKEAARDALRIGRLLNIDKDFALAIEKRLTEQQTDTEQ